MLFSQWSDIMARKVTMKTGDFLQEVDPEGWYNLTVESVEDYTPTEDTKSYGDAVYVLYTVTKGKEEVGKTRELCSLKLSPLSKLYDRYTSALNIDDIEGGEEVDIDKMVGKELIGLLTNDSRKDSKFVTITRTRPYKAGAVDEEPEPPKAVVPPADVGGEEDETEGMFQCGDCDADVPEDADECPGCGAVFESEETEPEDDDTPVCDFCGEKQERRELKALDGKFFHDEYGIRCRDEYLKEKKKKRREANKKKTPPKKKATKKTPKKPAKKKTTKKKR